MKQFITRSTLILCILLTATHSIVGQASPAAADLEARRLAFAATPDYDAYQLEVTQVALLAQHAERALDPEMSVADLNEPLQQLEAIYPLGIKVNVTIAAFLEYVISLEREGPGNEELIVDLERIAQSRRDKAWTILQSILASGDGAAPASAYLVINTLEEQAVLEHLEVDLESRSIVEEGGRYFDALRVRTEHARERVIYFDIGPFYSPPEQRAI